MTMMSLNVGCGSDFRGDLRLDIQKTEAATILADAQFMPFRSQVFDLVFSLSVLEHIPFWSQALKEMMRVCRKELVLEVPVNSDLRKTEIFRLLLPTPSNLRLLFSMPRRARETFWQMDPLILIRVLLNHGFLAGVRKVIQVYAGMPSRCWRIVGVRLHDKSN